MNTLKIGAKVCIARNGAPNEAVFTARYIGHIPHRETNQLQPVFMSAGGIIHLGYECWFQFAFESEPPYDINPRISLRASD